ncbi:hypothetical protein HanRHA438_Chr09g0380971 [Helianthus annuus]|nr:hypothetical protein HanRHA438_Chr09g0380971 [Helianthus annuus]
MIFDMKRPFSSEIVISREITFGAESLWSGIKTSIYKRNHLMNNFKRNQKLILKQNLLDDTSSEIRNNLSSGIPL